MVEPASACLTYLNAAARTQAAAQHRTFGAFRAPGQGLSAGYVKPRKACRPTLGRRALSSWEPWGRERCCSGSTLSRPGVGPARLPQTCMRVPTSASPHRVLVFGPVWLHAVPVQAARRRLTVSRTPARHGEHKPLFETCQEPTTAAALNRRREAKVMLAEELGKPGPRSTEMDFLPHHRQERLPQLGG